MDSFSLMSVMYIFQSLSSPYKLQDLSLPLLEAHSTLHFFQSSPPFDHHGSSCCISIQFMLETMMSMLNKLVNSSTRRGLDVDAPALASSPGGSPSRKDSEHEPALAPAAQTADPANDNEQVRTRERARLTLLVETTLRQKPQNHLWA